jgi:hypothetical protein
MVSTCPHTLGAHDEHGFVDPNMFYTSSFKENHEKGEPILTYVAYQLFSDEKQSACPPEQLPYENKCILVQDPTSTCDTRKDAYNRKSDSFREANSKSSLQTKPSSFSLSHKTEIA